MPLSPSLATVGRKSASVLRRNAVDGANIVGDFAQTRARVFKDRRNALALFCPTATHGFRHPHLSRPRVICLYDEQLFSSRLGSGISAGGRRRSYRSGCRGSSERAGDFNERRWPNHPPWLPLAVFVRNQGRVVAGLVGETYCGWLFIRYLWV